MSLNNLSATNKICIGEYDVIKLTSKPIFSQQYHVPWLPAGPDNTETDWYIFSILVLTARVIFTMDVWKFYHGNCVNARVTVKNTLFDSELVPLESCRL